MNAKRIFAFLFIIVALFGATTMTTSAQSGCDTTAVLELARMARAEGYYGVKVDLATCSVDIIFENPTAMQPMQPRGGDDDATSALPMPASPEPQKSGACEVVHDSIVSASDTEIASDTEWLRVQLWSPGTPEHESVLPPGRYLKSPAVAGYVWEFSPGCSMEQLVQDAQKSSERRDEAGASTAGYVEWQSLVGRGWLQVAWQANTEAQSSESEPQAMTEPATTSEMTATEDSSASAGGTSAGESSANTSSCTLEQQTLDIGDHDLTGPGVVTLWTNQTSRDQGVVPWDQEEVKVFMNDTNVWRFRQVGGTFYEGVNCDPSAAELQDKLDSLDFEEKTWAELNEYGLAE